MESISISGFISLEAVITSEKRIINEIILDSERFEKIMNSGYHFAEKVQYNKIFDFCKKNNIKKRFITKNKFAQHFKSQTAGGIAAFVSERKYCDDVFKNDFILLFEGIEDPFNFGHLLRTAYAAGINGIIIPNRCLKNSEDTIIRSSAGAYEFLNIYAYNNIDEIIKKFKSKPYQIIAASCTENAVSIYEQQYIKPVCLIIGGEKRGISKELLRLSDVIIKIPYNREVDFSLSAASAASIIIFEISRKIIC